VTGSALPRSRDFQKVSGPETGLRGFAFVSRYVWLYTHRNEDGDESIDRPRPYRAGA
jgi:hypothetical protein